MSSAVFHSHAPVVPVLVFPQEPDLGSCLFPRVLLCVSHTDTLTPLWEGKTPLPTALNETSRFPEVLKDKEVA